MAMFGGLVMTNNGRNLYAKAQTGKLLKVTKIVLGDGELGSSESMISMTALKNKILECSILDMKIMQNEIAKITFILTNKELLEGFTWRELGVIAEEPDTKEEILYCYGNARENGEYISPKGGADILEKHVSIDLVISNVENVSAVIDESLVFATKKEVEESISQAQQELIDDLGKTYSGTNITAPTVAGYGRINKLKGTVNGIGADKNLFDGLFEIGSMNTTTGALVDSTTRVRSINYISVESEQEYIVSMRAKSLYQVIIMEYDSSRTFITSTVWTDFDYTFTTSSNARYIKILVRLKTDETINFETMDKYVKLQKGSVATQYSPYGYGIVENISASGEEKLSNVCYVSNTLTEDDFIDYIEGKVKRNTVLNGTEDWVIDISLVNGRNYFYTGSPITKYSKPLGYIESPIHKNTKDACDIYNDDMISIASNGCVCIFMNEFSTVEEFTAWLTENPLPVTYDRNIDLLNCSNKIVQYEDSTNVYNRDGAEIEVNLTNSETISELNENLDNIEKNYIKNQIKTVNAITITNGTAATLRQCRYGQLVSIFINLKLTLTANSYTKIGQLNLKPVQAISLPVGILNNQYADHFTSAVQEMLFVDLDGSVYIRSLNEHTDKFARFNLTYLTND